MIQVNLLPDVKMQYIRAKRLQRLIVSVSVIVVGAMIALFVVLFLTVKVWQKQRINDLSSKVQSLNTQLTETSDLNRILTVQNQLRTLTELHEAKPAATRLSKYLGQITPIGVTLSTVSVNFEASTIKLEGTGPDLQSINRLVDTIKFTKYNTGGETPEEKNAFSSVVLTSFGRSTKGASYAINFNYEPLIFASTSDKLRLVVPKIVTTRSETERPQALFEAQGDTLPTTQGGSQ